MLLSVQIDVHSLSLLGSSRVQVRSRDLCVVRPRAAVSASQSSITTTSALHSERLAHDGAALSDDLQVRHHAATGRGLVDLAARRQGAQSGGRSLAQERAHGVRLAEESLHGGSFGDKA